MKRTFLQFLLSCLVIQDGCLAADGWLATERIDGNLSLAEARSAYDFGQPSKRLENSNPILRKSELTATISRGLVPIDFLYSNASESADGWLARQNKITYLAKAELRQLQHTPMVADSSNDTFGARKANPIIHSDTLKAAQLAGLGYANQAKDHRNAVQIATSEKIGPKQIRLRLGAENLVVVEGGKIIFDHVGQNIHLVKDPQLTNTEMSLYVRDKDVIQVTKASTEVKSLKSGATELFVVTPGRISIIQCEAPESKNSDRPGPLTSEIVEKIVQNLAIAIPESLTSVQGLDLSTTVTPTIAANHSREDTTPANLIVEQEVTKLGPSSIDQRLNFVRASLKSSFLSVKVKVVDERSKLNTSLFPVAGVRVRIAGTEYSEVTDNLGEVLLTDVPSASRLLLVLSDDRGYLMPQAAELQIAAQSSGQTLVIPTRRFSSLDLAARGSGVVQNMGKGSFCGHATEGERDLAGARIAIDSRGIGPIYFNHLGLPDLRLGATSGNGMFCFFNVEPGPLNIAFRRGQSERALTTTLAIFGGLHIEEHFDLNHARLPKLNVALMASANAQLDSEISKNQRLDEVETAEAFILGSGDKMETDHGGQLVGSEAVLPFKGRVLAAGSSDESDLTVQAQNLNEDDRQRLFTLVPNGFMTDMAVFAQATHDLASGGVIVEHGNLSDVSSDGAKIRLVDAHGKDIGDGWYFADKPAAKAIFFNVPSGTYSVIVESAAGHWLAADLVYVYSESVSVTRLGSPYTVVPSHHE